MSVDDNQFEVLMLEKLIPREPHEGFSSRHELLTEGVTERLSGVITTMGGLAIDEPAEMGRRIERLYDEGKTDITLHAATRALDKYLYNSVWRYDGERREDHQVEVLHDILDSLSAGTMSSHYELATSTGKNLIMAKLAEAFSTAGLRVLMLAPTVPIANQLIGKDMNKGLERFTRDIDIAKVGRHFGGKKAKRSDGLIVSTYQSLNKFAETNNLGEFDVILGDEAHRALGEKTMDSLSSFSPHAIRLGFTATADYGENKSVSQVFGEKLHQIKLREAIEKGLVSAVQCLTFETGETIRIRDPYSSDFTDRELERLMSLKARNERAIQFASDFVAEGRQGIIACLPGSDMAHPKLLAELLGAEQIRDKHTGQMRNLVARSVGNHLSSEENKVILREYEEGKIDVLTFVNLISEGWDSDRASFLINTCPTTSNVKLTQQIGRVIRLKPGFPKAIVVDFVDRAIGKKQVTAMQVLGEQEVSLGLVFSSKKSAETEEDATSYLRGILSPELYSNLYSNQGRLISDLSIPPSKLVDKRRQEYFDRLLEREGLGTDQHAMSVPFNVRREIREFEEEYRAANEVLPTQVEITDYLTELGLIKGRNTDIAIQRMLAARFVERAGLLVNLPDESYDDPIYGDPADRFERGPTRAEVTTMFANSRLDDRGKATLSLKYGLDNHPERTYDEVGEQFGVTRERVRQIESKSLAILRGLRFAEVLLPRDIVVETYKPRMEYTQVTDTTKLLSWLAELVDYPEAWDTARDLGMTREYSRMTGRTGPVAFGSDVKSRKRRHQSILPPAHRAEQRDFDTEALLRLVEAASSYYEHRDAQAKGTGRLIAEAVNIKKLAVATLAGRAETPTREVAADSIAVSWTSQTVNEIKQITNRTFHKHFPLGGDLNKRVELVDELVSYYRSQVHPAILSGGDATAMSGELQNDWYIARRQFYKDIEAESGLRHGEATMDEQRKYFADSTNTLTDQRAKNILVDVLLLLEYKFNEFVAREVELELQKTLVLDA